MLILPLNPDLTVGRRPLVTYAVVFLCIAVHLFNHRSMTLAEQAAEAYCARLPAPWLQTASSYLVEADLDDCAETLLWMHERDSRGEIEETYRESLYRDRQQQAEIDFSNELHLLLERYEEFAEIAPVSLMAAMLYYPDEPSLLRMFSSEFLHADWRHVIFNMILYLAFATAIEILIGNALVYVAIMATIAVVSGIAYSLYTAAFGSAYPSLGFSDIVMGMIGLSAYLMPGVRIRAFLWLGLWAWTVFIPAWIFAAWYIGRDALQLLSTGNEGGINLVAHVAGGFTGYCLGAWWLADRKWLISEELRAEVEDRRSARGSWFGITGCRVNTRAFRKQGAAEEIRARARAFDELLLRVYKLNENHQHRAAWDTLREELARQGESGETLGSVFETVLSWTPSRLTSRVAQRYVSHLLDHGKQKDALNACERYLALYPDFALARPLDVMALARAAFRQGRFALAHALVRCAQARYGEAIDTTSARLLEARLLACHLDRPEDADAIVQDLLRQQPSHRLPEISAVAASIAPLLR